MNRGGIRLPFDLLGIPVKLDYSFLLILPLFAYLIGSRIGGYAALLRSFGVPVDPAGLEQGATPWVLGLVSAIGLFTSVLLHELGHAVVARLYGVKVREIRLWFLGGVAQFDQMPRARGGEAVVAAVGPITSVVIGLLLWQAVPLARGYDGVLVVISYLAITNVVLALFNLLPALPLDGGRILRGLLALVLPHLRATQVAATVSAFVAILLGLYGFFSMNFLLVVLAFFVYNAGRAEAQAAVLSDAFEGKRVADLMSTDPVTVLPDMPLEQFVRLIHYRPHTGYPVVDEGGELLGFARISDAREQEAANEADADGSPSPAATEPTITDRPTVASIVRKAETIRPNESAMSALQRVAEGDLGRLLVVDRGGRLLGILSKSDLLALVRGRTGGVAVDPGAQDDGTP